VGVGEEDNKMNKHYIPVLCCSSDKTKDRFCYNGKFYKFVAYPQEVAQGGVIFYKPDDRIPGENKTWRDLVLEQNEPDLVPAYELYSRDIYRDLYHEFGNYFYILSAGWGIIRADFKIPAYDITYSTDKKIPGFVKRINNQNWNDINHLQEDAKKFDSNSEIILFAGSDYAPRFCDMTQYIKCTKKILYKSLKLIRQQGFIYEYYKTKINTNWFYKAAQDFLDNYTKINQVSSNVTFQQSFSYFGFHAPPRKKEELQMPYRKMVQEHHSDNKKMKEINDMYRKAVDYWGS
jgi:hypothetical protein